MQWIASVEHIEALNPGIVVAGHKRPDARDDEPAAIFGGTKTYIRDFERSLSGSHSAQELVDKMMVLHSDRGNPYTLWTAAQGVFEQARTGSIFLTTPRPEGRGFQPSQAGVPVSRPTAPGGIRSV